MFDRTAFFLIGLTTLLRLSQAIHIQESINHFYEDGQCTFEDFAEGRVQPRILGGSNAKFGGFPWMALLFYKKFVHLAYHDYPECGGSVISSRLVLTAARCLRKSEALSFVRLGEYDRSSPRDCSHSRCAPEPIDLQDFHTVVHDQYDDLLGINDIGLIHLHAELRFNEFIKPVCLPITPELHSLTSSDFEGNVMTMAGWGNIVTKPGVEEARVLQKAEVALLADDECNIPPDHGPAHSTPTTFRGAPTQACAGGPGRSGACAGDAGGPLLYDPGSGSQWQMGIVSFARPTCKRGWQYVPYTVFTWIPHYITWILDQIEKDNVMN